MTLMAFVNADASMAADSLNVMLSPHAVMFDELFNTYFERLDAFLPLLRESILNEMTMEELHSARVNMLQLITSHEALYDRLAGLVNLTVSDMDDG